MSGTTQKKKTGLVLSGGGARCVAQLGILKVLRENGIYPDIYAGTSAGAVAAAFHIASYSDKEILRIIREGNIFNIRNLLLRKQGVYSMKGFQTIYETYFPHNSFEDLHLPLYVAATDLLKGETVYFSSGNLSKALMASCCIPVIFQPLAYLNTLFVDGGVLDNFPVQAIQNKCDYLIGIHVNAIQKENLEIHMNTVLDRSIHLALSASVAYKAKSCHLFLEPPDMSRFSVLDIDKLDEIYAFGYDYAKSEETKIKKLASEILSNP